LEACEGSSGIEMAGTNDGCPVYIEYGFGRYEYPVTPCKGDEHADSLTEPGVPICSADIWAGS